MPGFSLINASGLSQPADTLVTKISNALGRHFDPRQAIRMAEAEAQADRIRRVSEAETDIEIADIRQRAADRFLNEEMTRQMNMESIIEKAMPHLNNDANPEGMENDWITNFFDKCRIVSDEEMQQVWARILAGEANNPGSFSRRTVNLVADLGKDDAQLFRSLCGFTWMIGFPETLVFDTVADIYNTKGITFDTLSQLESLGLIRYDPNPFGRINLPDKCYVSYYGKAVELEFPQGKEKQLSIGNVLLTQSGRELAFICGSTPVEGFFEYVYDRWAGESLVPPRELPPEG